MTLEHLGYKVDVAATGAEALRAMESARYDVVLMDVRMPGMDGYETTAEIRRREGSRSHTPIIAMTAHALQGDRDRCIAVGMDDYVSKPIDVDELAGKIERWAGRPDRETNPDIALPQGGDETLDPAVLANFASLMGAKAGERIWELIQVFLRDSENRIDGLKAAADAGDREALERLAHTLKGSSGNLGARKMMRLCDAIETRARDGEAFDSTPMVADLEREFGRVRGALGAEMRKYDTSR